MPSLYVTTVASCLIVPVLYTRGPQWVGYYMKFGLYYISMTFAAAAMTPFAALQPQKTTNLLLPNRFMRFVATLLGLEWQVTPDSMPNLQMTPKSAVVVVNHQSSLDVLGLLTTLWPLFDGKLSCVAKKSLLWAGPFGLAAYLSGVTFIDRAKAKEAHNLLMGAVQAGKTSGIKVLVFPEGTRSHSLDKKDMLAFKKGAFTAAIAAQVPVLPIVFSHYNFLDTQAKVLRPGIVKVRVLAPIKTEGLGPDRAQELADLTRNVMLTAFAKTD